jgi:VanZ family protein
VNNKGRTCAALFILHLSKKLKSRYILFVPAIIWFLATTFLLTIPGSDLPKASFLDDIYFDKWVHIGLFAGLTFLTAFPFIKGNIATQKLLIKIGMAFIIYGILMEFVQRYFASERTFDILDILADSVGCVLGGWTANKLRLKIAGK